MKYTYEQVYNKSIEYFNGDEMAAKTFVDKYSLQDREGNYYEDTPDKMHRRLAKEFARIEKKYPNPLDEEIIYNYFKNFKYIVPQGSPMNAIGNNFQVQSASNCFVITPPEDSYSGIMRTDQEEAQIMKRRGGVGFDISTIRPRGAITANAAKTTDGIGLFMERFSNTCREVAQGGRRGALMLTISVHHPEIRTFIHIKEDLKKVTGANISIRLTDEFMEAVKKDENVELRFPVEKNVKHSMSESVNAKELWNEIIEAAWQSAEPGLLFWDTALKYTPSDIYAKFGYQSSATNPCGEIVLSNYDSCRLMVVNLLSFVIDPFTPNARFDYPKYKEVVMVAQRLMDDMIDLEIEQIDKILKKINDDPETQLTKTLEVNLWTKIREACVNGRRTGLGITALGDTLASLNIKYGTDQSVDITEEIYRNLAISAYTQTCMLAKDRGAFPIYDYDMEKNHPFIKRIMDEDANLKELYKKHGRRNIALTTTAPTGSVSIMTQTTSGIEPVYLPSYVRRKKINPNDKDVKVDFIDALGDRWQEFTVYHHGVKKWMEVTGEKDVTKSPYHGATSNDVDWSKSVDLQAVAQKWICHAISKTCNLPKTATKELVAEVYMRAWEKECKGFTVYRDGSRTGVLIAETPVKEEENEIIKDNHAPRRPDILECEIHKTKIDGGQWVCFVSLLNGRPYEVFTGLDDNILPPKNLKFGSIAKRRIGNGKSKYDLYFNKDREDEIMYKDIISHFKNDSYAAHARLISLALRHGIPIQYIVEQLQKIDNDTLFSFNKVISRVLKSYVKDGTSNGKKCSNCGEDKLIYQEGCLICSGCGYSKC